MSDSFDACAATVRTADYDRFLSALFAAEERRGHLLALYAFNYEVAKTAETVSQPVMGQIRLQWWRETIVEIYAGKARAHDVAQALAQAIAAHDLPQSLFDTVIDARERDIFPEGFANLLELETYADATSGAIMRLAARVLGAGVSLDELARHAGVAYAFTGLLRAIPFHAAQGRVMLPADFLIAAGVRDDDIFAGRAPGLNMVIERIADEARRHAARAAAQSVPRKYLPALLPAALVRPYWRVLMRRDFDPFRDRTDLSVPRRQLAMLAAMMRGRL